MHISFSRLTGLAAGALACATLVACGSEAGGGSAAKQSGGATSADRAQAAAIVKQASQPVKFVDPGGPVDLSKVQGTTIWAVTLDNSVPFVQKVLAGMSEAAKAGGASVKIIDAKGQANKAAAGIEQAVAAKASAIVAFGVNFNLVKNAVQVARDAGVPVIGALNTDVKAPLEDGAAGEVSFDYGRSGRLVAAYAIAKTAGGVHAAYQDLPGIDTFKAMRSGVEGAFADYCPSACSLNVDSLLAGDFKTQAQTKTAAQLARNPKLNWVIPAIDGLAQFTIPSIQASGKGADIKVGSINAFSANLQFIRDGKIQAVDVGNNNTWLGWAMFDRAARAVAGQPAAVSEVPIKLFDKDNLQGVDLENEDALFDNVDYRGAYQALWQR